LAGRLDLLGARLEAAAGRSQETLRLATRAEGFLRNANLPRDLAQAMGLQASVIETEESPAAWTRAGDLRLGAGRILYTLGDLPGAVAELEAAARLAVKADDIALGAAVRAVLEEIRAQLPSPAPVPAPAAVPGG